MVRLDGKGQVAQAVRAALAERPVRLIGRRRRTALEPVDRVVDLRNTLGEAALRADIAYLTDQPTTLVAMVRSAFGVGVINRLALQATSTEGLTIRTIDSPTAHREVALHWTRRRAGSAVVKAFLEAQQQVPLPPDVQPIPD